MIGLSTLLRVTTGLSIDTAAAYARNVPRFIREAKQYRALAAKGPFPFEVRNVRPLLADYAGQAGTASGHYFAQDLWVARQVFARRPSHHLDVGSRIDGFVAHLLTFMPVTVVDIRPLSSDVDGLTFLKDDACELKQVPDRSIESLSCLHALEHFGLGRYSDPIDPTAWERAVRAFRRVLSMHGRLYISVPVGVERVEFNAQRVFRPETLLTSAHGLTLDRFSALLPDGRFIRDADVSDVCSYRLALGLFEFVKPT